MRNLGVNSTSFSLDVMWLDNMDRANAFHYHREKTDDAFQTASALAAYVNSLQGEKIIMAHSLGQQKSAKGKSRAIGVVF